MRRERRERPYAGIASRNQLWQLNRAGMLKLDPDGTLEPLTSEQVRELVGEVLAALPAGRTISDYTREDIESDLSGE